MITSIRLVNWRSHKDTSLEFSRGTNLLVGIMGGGKSSVLEGISFALFGTFPALERRRVRLDDVVRFNEGQASIVLGMRWNGNDYRIEREVRRKDKRTATRAEIFRDGSLIDSGSTAVTSYVEQLLGVDYDLFTRAIYSEQNNIDYFLNLDPRRRKEEIDKLLGLDRFEEARGNIVSVINRTVSNRKTLEEKFDRASMEETLKTLDDYKKEINGLEKKVGELRKEYEDAEKTVADEEKKFSGIRKEREKYEMLERELTKVNGMAESLRPEIKEEITEKEFNAVKERLERVNEQLKKTRDKKNKLETERSALSKELGSLDEQLKSEKERAERIAKLGKALDELLEGKAIGHFRDELGKMEDEETGLNSEMKALSDEINETKELFEKLRPGMAECPLCGSGLDEKGIGHIKKEKKTIVEKNSRRIKEIEGRIPKVRNAAEKLELRVKKIEFAEDKIATLEKERKDIAKIEEKKKNLESRFSDMSGEIELSEKEFSEKRNEAEELRMTTEKYGQILEKKKRLTELEKREKELLKEKNAVKYDEKSFEERRGALEQARLRRQKTESEKSAAEEQIGMKRETAGMLEKRIREMGEMEKRISELSKLSEELTIFKNALLDTQVTLRKNLIEAINAAMNEIWEIFYPYKNYTMVRLGVTERDYVFEVHERGEWKALETFASGGERACAALTLRVALATVLTPNLSWLILDEPTHNLDKEAVSLLSETLQLKVPQVVNQTFVITHEEGLIGADFATSYKLTRTKEAEGPTETESL